MGSRMVSRTTIFVAIDVTRDLITLCSPLYALSALLFRAATSMRSIRAAKPYLQRARDNGRIYKEHVNKGGST